MFRLKLLLSALLLQFGTFLWAGEGMWLPHLLKQLNESEMQAMGMKMTAEDIYSINNGSLKDAIVHFGGFCTSEVISDRGLLLTNHHCGYSAIQSHSTMENNYLRDGFWAESLADEIPNEGLFATFIVKIEEVTREVLRDVDASMSQTERQSAIDKNLARLRDNYDRADYQDVMIKPFYKGNQYFLFVTETYNDVRLVGTPPESIGKFGADTDNWEWPRHTGDFALFRIYAGPDNKPAAYDPANIPLKPRHSLPISLDGVEEDDFTLVFGFPGSTNEYLPSFAIENMLEYQNPVKIRIRQEALDVMDKFMRQDEKIRLQYASKFARIANYWKKWIGESQGLRKSNALESKKGYENELVSLMADDRKLFDKYGSLLPQFKEWYTQIRPYAVARDAFGEVFGRNIDAFRVASMVRRLVNTYENNGEAAYRDLADAYTDRMGSIYKNYDPRIDQEVFGRLIQTYADVVDPAFVPDEIEKQGLFMRAMSYDELAADAFAGSILDNEADMMSALYKDGEAFKAIESDPIYKIYMAARQLYVDSVSARYNELQGNINDAMKSYMEAQMELLPDQRFYPDANGTMRVTYGKVRGYTPRDAIYYKPVTYLEGVMEKYKPGDYEFDVPEKLIDLYNDRDYGQYADEKGLPICFLGSNHTTGGNSGSPVIDAHGNLIGLNFDRVWEGTMSDYNYDIRICRNIMVDVRYILFIVDKFAGATHLIEELNLVHPKS